MSHADSTERMYKWCTCLWPFRMTCCKPRTCVFRQLEGAVRINLTSHSEFLQTGSLSLSSLFSLVSVSFSFFFLLASFFFLLSSLSSLFFSLFTSTLMATCSHATAHLHTRNISSGARKLALSNAREHNPPPSEKAKNDSLLPDGSCDRLPKKVLISLTRSLSISFAFTFRLLALSGSALFVLLTAVTLASFEVFTIPSTIFVSLVHFLSTSALDNFHH